MTDRSPLALGAVLGWTLALTLSAAPAMGQDVPANAQADNAATVEPVPAPMPQPEPVVVNEEPAEEPVRERVVEPDERAAANATVPEAEEPAPVALPVPSGPPVVNVASPAEEIAAPVAAAVPAPEEGRSSWLWVLVAVGALAAVFAGARLVRRRATVRPAPAAPRPAARTVVPETVPVEPAPVTPEPGPAATMAEGRARLEVGFRPLRAGLNLLSATAEGSFVLVNRGDRPATGIRFGALLLPAYADLDTELVELWAGGVTRPVVAPFALVPGEEREVRHILSLPRAAIEPLMTGGRPMFVPVVAISAIYDRGADAEGSEEGQVGRAWILGVVREGADRLAPLWLDEPPRNRDDMAARPHRASVDR